MSKIENLAVRDKYSHLGVGVFETLRLTVRTDGKLGFASDFRQHLLRMEHGAKRLGTIYPSQTQFLREISASNIVAPGNYRLRILSKRERWELDIETFCPYQVPEQGCSVVSVVEERCLPELKSFSALTSVLAREYAESRNSYEALLIDRQGYLREGAWSNVFWLSEDGIWRTPAKSILPGVIRKEVLELLGDLVLEEDKYFSDILDAAREMFLTQATNGIIPVGSVDGKLLSGVSQSQRLRQKLSESSWFPLIA